MKENNPYFDPQPNVPTTLKLFKNFKNGTNKKGNVYYGWEVEDTATGAAYSWFINDIETHEEIEALKKSGQQAVVTLMLAKGRSPRYDVKSAFFDGRGNIPKETPAPDLTDETYRATRKNGIYSALIDAAEVAQRYNATEHGTRYPLGPEDVRTIAIHLNIGFERKQ